MKGILILIFITIIFDCCSFSSDKEQSAPIKKQSEKLKSKNFFDYDEIDHYSSRYGDMDVEKLYNNQSRSKIDSLKTAVVLGDTPKGISDLSFIVKLESLGYKKNAVDKSKFEEIDKIFMEKSVKQIIMYSCIYVYNDILIFKKQKKVIGTAKICFGCMGNEIKGTNANTENFGQDGDYEKLEKLLGK